MHYTFATDFLCPCLLPEVSFPCTNRHNCKKKKKTLGNKHPASYTSDLLQDQPLPCGEQRTTKETIPVKQPSVHSGSTQRIFSREPSGEGKGQGWCHGCLDAERQDWEGTRRESLNKANYWSTAPWDEAWPRDVKQGKVKRDNQGPISVQTLVWHLGHHFGGWNSQWCLELWLLLGPEGGVLVVVYTLDGLARACKIRFARAWHLGGWRVHRVLIDRAPRSPPLWFLNSL